VAAAANAQGAATYVVAVGDGVEWFTVCKPTRVAPFGDGRRLVRRHDPDAGCWETVVARWDVERAVWVGEG
jgi:hypothetical protein